MLRPSITKRTIERRAAVSVAIIATFAMLQCTPASVFAQTVGPPSTTSITGHPYAPHVADAARRFGIPDAWIWSVIRIESAGNARAVSPAGAMGLMQIMPTTWAQLRSRHGLGSDPFDVRDNIMAGAAYLREMYDRYGDVTAMVAAYNAGPGRYEEYLRGRPLPAETRAYLAKLTSITGARADGRLAVALPNDPFAWRRSALFIRIARTADATTSAAVDGDDSRQDSALEPPLPSDNRAAAAPSGASQSAPTEMLFVRRSGAGRPQ